MYKLIILLVVVIAVLSFAFLEGSKKINTIDTGKGLKDSQYCRAVDFPKQDVSPTEEKELIYMREEEKLAHDFYYIMYDKWGLRPFQNITSAEERHMGAIKAMLDKYSISDPVKDMSVGAFTNGDIKMLYDNLVVQGNKSAVDALKAGAEIEELDIKDLLAAITDTDNDDLKFVYNNLVNGSYNHLRAFMRNLDKRNAEYSPKHLDKKTFEEILNN